MNKHFYLIIIFMLSSVITICINNIIIGNTFFGYTILIINIISLIIYILLYIKAKTK
jgi:hypothetical protein